MNRDAACEILVRRYFTKADQALKTARLNCEAGDANGAINRLYYACFYALTAQMLAAGKQFIRHSAIRNALNEHLVHAGILAAELGRFYNRLFTDRNDADYEPMADFDLADIQARLPVAEAFIATMKRLAKWEPDL